ncbi:MAG: hypothetical protein HFJ25_03815 [Clostridia bacterium]|nr:hypothetical protein [Clostridia bacterium]
MEGATGMTAVITALTTTLSADNLWAVFANAVPLIGVVTLVALGFFLVRRAVKKLSKMRGGV